jgi:hypothetical protein
MNSFQRHTDAPAHLSWMAETPDIEPLRIHELILPGSHNSGSDKHSPNLGVPQEYAQDESPLEQLRQGVRALDLRVTFHDQYPEGDPNRFQLFHLTSSGRTVAIDIVEAVREFFAELESSGEAAREIVILDFHQFKGFTDEAHAQLQAMVFNGLGTRVIPYALHDWKLEHIWNLRPGKNVVVAYNHGSVINEGWDGVSQRWPGENLFNTNTLKAFVDNVAAEEKPSRALHAVQCAKYSLPFHAPTDLSHKIDEWFRSVDENSYIQNFYIINTDWTSRSQLVDNCRHANAVRGARKSSHPDDAMQPLRR